MITKFLSMVPVERKNIQRLGHQPVTGKIPALPEISGVMSLLLFFMCKLGITALPSLKWVFEDEEIKDCEECRCSGNQGRRGI